jgi:hypothetical protein
MTYYSIKACHFVFQINSMHCTLREGQTLKAFNKKEEGGPLRGEENGINYNKEYVITITLMAPTCSLNCGNKKHKGYFHGTTFGKQSLQGL